MLIFELLKVVLIISLIIIHLSMLSTERVRRWLEVKVLTGMSKNDIMGLRGFKVT